jgi:hypothetical protein
LTPRNVERREGAVRGFGHIEARTFSELTREPLFEFTACLYSDSLDRPSEVTILSE